MKTLCLSVLLLTAAAGVLRADPVIKFDDLSGDNSPMPAGYHLLSWDGFYYLDGVHFGGNPSGYGAGVVSSNDVIYPLNNTTASIRGGMFDFVSANATAAYNDNLQLEAKGYYKGTLIYDVTNTLSATSPTLITYGFYGVDEVDFVSSGGTTHSGYPPLGMYFVLDNVSVTTYVPYAPASMTNGGFETGDFSGWSRSGNLFNTYATNTPTYVHSGSFGAQLGPTASGFLGQNFPTQIGESYTVSFWLANAGGSQNSFNVLWNNSSVYGFTNTPPFSFANVQLNVVAIRPSQFLQFQFLNGPSFFGFDDVTVTPTVLVSNGGFETGDFSGWTHFGNAGDDGVNNGFQKTGTLGAFFGAVGPSSFISQNIATQPGQPYLVSAWLSRSGETPNEFQASWSGQSLADQANVTTLGWTNLHYTVVNGKAQNTLQFGFRDDNAFFYLDEVSVIPTPLVQNGGFELGDFTGWTQSGNTGFTSVGFSNGIPVNTGFYSAAFGPSGSLGFLSQNVATVPGQTYLIGFMLNNPGPMVNSRFQLSWNGAILMDTTNLGLTGWIPYEFAVTATGPNTTLQFGFRDDPSFLGLDDVFISPIPAPVIQSIAKTNANVNLAWSALPGYLYQLQYTTNLSVPNWNIVQGLTFPTNFPMTATDTNPPDAQRFYRVQLAPPPLIF